MGPFTNLILAAMIATGFLTAGLPASTNTLQAKQHPASPSRQAFAALTPTLR